MIGIYIICYFCFPLAILINIHKTYAENEFLNRQEVTCIKGVAACFVILAHLNIYLGEDGLKIYTVLGGMGVLLFFFLSGYGIYKGYGEKNINIKFLSKRFINVYFPSVVIQAVFYLVSIIKNEVFDVKSMMLTTFFGAWFIDVIMLCYLIFFLVCIIVKNNNQMRIILCFLVSALTGIMFWYGNFNARWYNAIMLFPFGMLIAYLEKKLIKFVQQKWFLCFCISLFLFGISGVIFIYYKTSVVWIGMVKTFSGMALSVWICVVFCRIEICSGIMKYIGKRSLYFYLIHLNLLMILEMTEKIPKIYAFYIILILMFPISEICYRMWNMISEKQGEKMR